jgi:hypothetical protein
VVDLNPAGFSSSFTTGTNGQKQVGYGWVSADHRHALVWSGSADSVIDLHQFLPSGYYDSRAHGIDEQGYITQ